jgi:anti-sigma factor RsiW
MKTSEFEQQFTAWLDGQLSAEAAAAFETELRARGFDPAAERAAVEKTASLLARHSTTPALPNAEFFNHQLLHRIEQEERATAVEKPSRSWWTLPRLAWSGAFSLLIAAVMFKAMIPVSSPERSPYFATVVDARTFEPTISATTVYDPRDNVTVLWLDGLDYLPADYVLQ